MALTLDSIHQPLNDFFLNHFKADASSPVMFRFDKFGSVVDDDDFVDDAHPDFGPSPALARERFSDLVNRTPVDAGDGATVVLSENSIDDAYFFRLLSPALPYVPETDDAARAQSTTDAFNGLKAMALKKWNDLVLESSSGLMLQFKPSLASPETWYDKTKTDNWTNQSFTITDTSAPPAPTAGPPASNQLWRLRPDEAIMMKALAIPTPAPTPAPPPAPTPELVDRGVAMVRVDRLQTLRRRLAIMPTEVIAPTDEVAPAAPMALVAPMEFHIEFAKRFRTLDVRDRLAVNQLVADTAPTEPVKSNEITVKFDYCLVNISRPWYVDAFVNEHSWFVPATKKGELTASGPSGNLPLLPIAFVAIRNLEIAANWAVEDVANAATATDFGPFRVSTGIVDNKLSHVGLQIIGWLVQTMPALPPNDPPAPTP